MGLPELLFDGYLRFVDSTDALTQVLELQEARKITPEDAAVLRGFLGLVQ